MGAMVALVVPVALAMPSALAMHAVQLVMALVLAECQHKALKAGELFHSYLPCWVRTSRKCAPPLPHFRMVQTLVGFTWLDLIVLDYHCWWRWWRQQWWH